MESPTARIAAGVAIGLASVVSVLNLEDWQRALAEPAPKAPLNTGSPAGPAFLIDLSKGYDEETHYLADYTMDEDWIKIVYEPDNIRFDSSGMTLQLIKTRGPLPFSGSEFQRNGTYGYGRYEAVLQAAKGHGAITAFFIYTGSHWDDPHDEIDFEFVASKSRSVRLNHFRDGVDHVVDIPLWFDAASERHLYAFEWTPDSIRWYVDGIKVHEATSESEGGIPTTSGRVMANLWAPWGDSTKWAGEARFARTSAGIRCISHVPLGETNAQCSDSFQPPKR